MEQMSRSADFGRKRWLILAAICLISLCLGSIYSWSVFAASMADYFQTRLHMDISPGDLSIVYSVANAVGPAGMITGGWFNDRFGPRKVIAAGGILFSGGMILSGFASGTGTLILSYGLCTGLGLGITYGTAISTGVKYFPDRKGLIGGLITAVYGMSSVILPPLVTVIVELSDAPTAFRTFGTVFLIVILICTAFLSRCLQRCSSEDCTDSGKTDASGMDADWKTMIRTPVFYVMMFLLLCGAFSGMMITSQAASVAQILVGMTPLEASAAVSVLSLFNAAGRISAGYISDKIGRANTLAAACVLSATGLICLYFSSPLSIGLFYMGIVAAGLSFGSFMGVFPGFTADQFGTKHNSVNYGIMFIGFALAGCIGPQIMRSIFIQTGSYGNAFLSACAMNAAGIFLIWIYRKLK